MPLPGACLATWSSLGFLALLGLGLADQARDLTDRELAAAEGGQHVVAPVEVVAAADLVQLRLLLDAQPRELLLEQDLALADVAVVVQLLEPLAHPVAGLGGRDVAVVRAQPVAAGGGVLLGEDLHRLTADQRLVEGHDAPVDAGTAAAVSDLGMDGVGEVERRRALGQLDHLGLGGQHVDMGRLETRT